ncbi:MAG: aldo/keto reductase [Clostridia bacterium]
MKMNKLGKSDILVSAFGMGCWSYGGGSYWGEQSQSNVDDIVDYALNAGVNYFDTAEVYNNGDSEISLGLALKGKREKAIIGSKVSTSNVRKKDLIEHCEDSLKRLGTDYIDVYMLHWPVNQKAIEHFSTSETAFDNFPNAGEVMDTMKLLKKQGKIREIGVSNHGSKQIEELISLNSDFVVNELPYNLISRAVEKNILNTCKTNNIGVFGYMAYQQGILTNKYNHPSELSIAQLHSRHFAQTRGGDMSRHFEDGAEEEIANLLKVMADIAKEYGVTKNDLSLSWAMANDAITSTLVGSRDVKQLSENLKSAEYILCDDVKKALDKASKPIWDKMGDSPDYYENSKDSRIY